MTGDEKKKRDPIFTVCFVVFILAAVSVVGVYVDEHYLTEDNTLVAYGDDVTVNYVGTFYDFDGSDIAVEFDSGEIDFTAEAGSDVLQKFWEACIGHKVGDSVQVVINPEDGYIAPATGQDNVSMSGITGQDNVSMSGMTMDRTQVMSKAQFDSIYDYTLSGGSGLPIETVYGWKAMAFLDSATQMVTIYHMPEVGQTTTYTYDDESEDAEEVTSIEGDTITYNIGFEGYTSVGSGDEVQMIELQFGDETWQVTNINGSTFSYKTSPNTANQTLYFEIEIVSIN